MCATLPIEQVIGTKLGGWWRPGTIHGPSCSRRPGAYASNCLRCEAPLKFALAGPALNASKLAEVKLQITSDLLTAHEPKIGNWVLFSPIPVTGAFRYREEFQLLPVPKGSPRPTYLAADHPFLLQFKHAGSANPWVDQRRRIARGLELELLLVGFTEQSHPR